MSNGNNGESMLKAIIFDIDGTLIESQQWQYDTWVIVLNKYNVKLSKEYYVPNLLGVEAKVQEPILKKKFNLDLPEGQLMKEKEDLILKWVSEKELPIIDTVFEVLDDVKKHGLKIAFATSSPYEEARIKIKRAGFDKYSNILVTRDDVKKSKPEPEIYLLTAEKLGVKFDECAAFEDSLPGVKSSKNAGMYAIAVPTSWTQAQDFSCADFLARDIMQGWEHLKNKGLDEKKKV